MLLWEQNHFSLFKSWSPPEYLFKLSVFWWGPHSATRQTKRKIKLDKYSRLFFPPIRVKQQSWTGLFEYPTGKALSNLLRCHSWSWPEEEGISLKYLSSHIILLSFRQRTTKPKLNFWTDKLQELAPTSSSGEFLPIRHEDLPGEPASSLFYLQYRHTFPKSTHCLTICKTSFKWISMSFITFF